MHLTINTTTLVVLLLVLLVGLVVGALLGALFARPSPAAIDPSRELGARRDVEARAAEAALVRESLDRLHDQMRDLAQHEVSWQSQLRQQVDDVRHSTDVLRRETSSLSTALRRPQVRGRWGELHLRRVVEIAGLVERCDFTEQLSTSADVGEDEQARVRRPDLVVHLAGGKNVVVDAKVPLDAFLDVGADRPDAPGSDGSDGSDAARARHLQRHARQLRTHVDALAAKSYWRSLPSTPEFVVLFVPGESFLSAALEAEPGLLEYAADRKVVLATPTTLIALLRTVAYAWTTATLNDRAREIHELGRDLHERLATMGGHLDRVGRSLGGAVSAYNRAVGSLENRVLVSARRFEDLGVTSDMLPAPEPLTDTPRPLTASELLEAVAEPRPELPGLDDPHAGPPRDVEPSPVRRVAP